MFLFLVSLIRGDMVQWEKSSSWIDPSPVERAWYEFLERKLDPLQRTADSGRPFEEPLRARPKQRPEVSQRGSKGGRRKLSGPRHQHEQTGREIFGQVHHYGYQEGAVMLMRKHQIYLPFFADFTGRVGPRAMRERLKVITTRTADIQTGTSTRGTIRSGH